MILSREIMKKNLAIALAAVVLLPNWNMSHSFEENYFNRQRGNQTYIVKRDPSIDREILETLKTDKMKRLEKRINDLDLETPAFKSLAEKRDEEATLKIAVKRSKKYVDEFFKISKDIPYEKERIFALIYAESEGDKLATSRKGARGLTQVMKSTWDWMEPHKNFNKHAYEPILNIGTGVKLLSWFEDYCKKNYPFWNELEEYGRIKVISACYNGGQRTLEEKGWDISKTKAETRKYAARLIWAYNKLKKEGINR
jgi:soluble lytic murein transglycosylase-like protein